MLISLMLGLGDQITLRTEILIQPHWHPRFNLQVALQEWS